MADRAPAEEVVDGLSGDMVKLSQRADGERGEDELTDDLSDLDHRVMIGIELFDPGLDTAVVALSGTKT